MTINITHLELKRLCQEMSELGAAQYIRQTKPSADLISQRKAFATFGEARVKRWANKGVVRSMRSGETQRSKLLYSVAELMAADASERLQPIIARSLS